MGLLSDSLFTITQQKVLAIVYGQPHRSFYTKEIIRLSKMGVATIKRELDRMLAAGVLTMKKIGNQHHYQANPDCPIYDEVSSIVRKTFGIADVIKKALDKNLDKIQNAFIFGSIASGKESSNSDIDVLVIGSISFMDLIQALYPAQEILGREINPKIYNISEWKTLKKSKDLLVQEIMSNPKINLVGEESEFR